MLERVLAIKQFPFIWEKNLMSWFTCGYSA